MVTEGSIRTEGKLGDGGISDQRLKVTGCTRSEKEARDSCEGVSVKVGLGLWRSSRYI